MQVNITLNFEQCWFLLFVFTTSILGTVIPLQMTLLLQVSFLA